MHHFNVTNGFVWFQKYLTTNLCLQSVFSAILINPQFFLTTLWAKYWILLFYLQSLGRYFLPQQVHMCFSTFYLHLLLFLGCRDCGKATAVCILHAWFFILKHFRDQVSMPDQVVSKPSFSSHTLNAWMLGVRGLRRCFQHRTWPSWHPPCSKSLSPSKGTSRISCSRCSAELQSYLLA